MTKSRLTHIRNDGMPGMVDVSAKRTTVRKARAGADLLFPAEVLAELRRTEWTTAKGAVWPTAIVAGTQAVKKTSELIPLCHPLPIDGCTILLVETEDGLRVTCEVTSTHRTGVEMEALTGAAVAALTVIDMCKALSPALCVSQLALLEKSGGRRRYRRA